MADFSQGAQGALGGAATGATLGSLVGPGGTVIGGIAGGAIGGLAGLFGGGDDLDPEAFQLPGFLDRQRRLTSAIDRSGGRGFDPTQASQLGVSGFRGGQEQLIAQLQQQALGQGPSLATQQFNTALDRGVATQQALAASGRGNAAQAARQAASNTGGLTQNLAGQAAQARIQEQLNARAQLGSVLGQGRQQDFARAQQNALLSQQTGQFNVNALFQNRGQNDALANQLRQLELQNAQLQQQGAIGFETGDFQPNQLGTQLLAAGGAVGAQALKQRGQ